MSQGKLAVLSIDDREDMQIADKASNVLGFSTEENKNKLGLSWAKLSASWIAFEVDCG